ncbi:MAG: hypothetical protein M1838_004251 [Thelocarpon superellum]|nr:MAG: hypothetical protein M1838_004251 [Thelocarpon superellum]
MSESSTGLKGPSSNLSGSGSASSAASMLDPDAALHDRRRGDSEDDRYGLGRHSIKGRHRTKGSGGFLLDTDLATNASGHVFLPVSKSRKTEKGKSRSGGSNAGPLPTPPAAHRRHRSAQSTSLGGSPLATQVTTVTPPAVRVDHDPLAHGAVQVYDGAGAGAGSGRKIQARSEGHDPVSARHTSAPSIGIDADPAQIVNLALSLSESRRRSANLTRLGSGSLHGHRTVSAAAPTSSPGSTGGSLRYSRQERPSPRNHSPSGDRRSSPSQSRSHHEAHNHLSIRTYPENTTTFPWESERDVEYTFSAATLARAEKAKAALELSAMYKHLLQYLPPLRPQPADPVGSFSTAPSSPVTLEFIRPLSRSTSGTGAGGFESRPYNPLQCVRNRKTRAREKMPVDPERDGWTDLTKVKAWVDQVEEESTLPTFRNGHRVRLPSFPDAEPESTSPPNSPNSGPPWGGGNAKQKRPRNDWSITPAECLADAYWLEQDTHKELIEDQHWHKIFPASSKPDPGSARGSSDEPRQAAPDVPVNRLAAKSSPDQDRDSGGFRSWRRSRLRDRSKRREADDEPRTRLHPWAREKGHSRSSSTSTNSNDGAGRGRTGFPEPSTDVFDTGDSVMLEQRMMAMLEKEVGREDWAPLNGIHSPLRVSPQKPLGQSPVKDGHQSRVVSSSSPDVKSAQRPHGRPDSRSAPAPEPEAERGRGSASPDGVGPTRVSMDGLDSTAPNSPQVLNAALGAQVPKGFIPSIALDLSLPDSRAVSPSRKVTDPIDRKRVVSDQDRPSVREASHAGKARPRATSLVKRPTSRRTSEGLGVEVETRRPRGERGDREPEGSRLRSFFKGGRLEEIVRTEVSRVGDFLSKKDNHLTPTVSSTASSVKSDASDVEEERPGLRRRATNASSRHRIRDEHDPGIRNIAGRDRPSLRSRQPSDVTCLSEDERKTAGMSTGTGTGTASNEPLPRPPQEPRHQLRSPRFGRPPPTRIDLPTADTVPARQGDAKDSAVSDVESRRSSFGFGREANAAVAPSHDGVRDADSRLNAALGFPGRAGVRHSYPMTGLARLDASATQRPLSRSGPAGGRHWSISDRELSVSRAPADPRETIRVRALLLSSGVKAREIVRLGDEVAPVPRSLLKSPSDWPTLRGSRSQHHMMVAQVETREMDATMRAFEQAATRFSDTTVARLLGQIRASTDRVNHKISPTARAAADDADALNAELSTTHTLALKQLNDALDLIARRRRRRFRWLRRFAYVLLEWTLLGAMWWVWLIVVAIRLVRGSVGGFVRAVRWLFWM